MFFFFQAEDGIRDIGVTGVQTCALPLTPREVEVLSHVAVGKSNREIARELHLSLSTVKTHLEHIFSKLEVNDRAQAAFRAAELNLLPEQTVENRSSPTSESAERSVT